MSIPSFGGYVLAGGRASRMGQDKARLPWRDSTLIEHIAGQVAAAAGAATIVGGQPVAGIRHIPDLWPGFGPVGGIATALRDAVSEWNVVVACDMPLITPAFLETLLSSAEGDAMIPVSRDGRVHPLCAIWRTPVLSAFESAITAGVHRLRDVLPGIHSTYLPVGDDRVLQNVNTPEEWAQVNALAGE